MSFHQTPPVLGNQFVEDRVLRSYLARTLPDDVLRSVEGSLDRLGALAGGELYDLQRRDRLNEPTLTHWDPWGHRIDQITLTPLWQRAARIAAEEGLVAVGYERAHGAFSRIDQFARVHLFNPSTDVYSCPLAMTDGAAKTLLSHPKTAVTEAAVARLTSRDPARMWTSGQWMTERTGGSDVSRTETVARRDGDDWRLYGTKWFSSATTSEMALTLARPEGNPEGSRGLALFYLETRRADGSLNHIAVNRLKDKLGTRKVPTAELTLDGTLAVPVAGLGEGVRNITPMLTITRTWNAICAVSGMRRAVALARDYARRRMAFGAMLSEKPLHADTLAGMAAEAEAHFHLAFRAVELLGRDESGVASDGEAELLRLITPLVKLTTAKAAVAVASEALECFGGAGFVEDTGLPQLLRDAQVLPIWEGTTNVLSLDALRAMARGSSIAALRREVGALASEVHDARLVEPMRTAADGIEQGIDWLSATQRDAQAMEAGARRLCLTLGRSYALALLCRHAQWSLVREGDLRAAAAARRFARHGVNLMANGSYADERDAVMALANDTPLE